MIKTTLDEYFVNSQEENGIILYSNHDCEYIKCIRSKIQEISAVEMVLQDRRRIDLVICDWYCEYYKTNEKEMLDTYFLYYFCNEDHPSEECSLMRLRFGFVEDCLYLVDDQGNETDNIFTAKTRLVCIHSFYISYSNGAFPALFTVLLGHFSKYPIIKDVIRTMEEYGVILPDLPPLKQLFIFHTKDELVRYLVPEVKGWHKRFNKEDLNSAYLRALLYNTIDERDLPKLRDESSLLDTITVDDSHFDEDQSEGIRAAVDGYSVWAYLVADLRGQYGETNVLYRYSEAELIHAYRELCFVKNIKPRLHLSKKTLEKLKDYLKHKELEEDSKIPLMVSDSVFNELMAVLPASVHPITSSAELFSLGEYMNNCVWDYRQDIRADRCLILKWTHDADYTVEIHYSQQNMIHPSFSVVQIRGRNNVNPSDNGYNTLCGIIAESNMRLYLPNKNDNEDKGK